MTDYSTRDVAEILGVPPSRIRSWARLRILDPDRDDRGAYRFSFRDVVLLRTARELEDAGLSTRRIRSALESLRSQLPDDHSLSAVQIAAAGDRVMVREEGTAWEPETGQLHMDFSVAEVEEAVAELPGPAGGIPSPGAPGGRPSAVDWYNVALDLEARDPEGAKDAYRRTLAADPDHADAHLNLGRLLHEEGELSAAESHYRTALNSDPASARAFFNLGVALQDQDRTDGAVEAYEAALRLDPDLAVAHFNLSRLLETLGRDAEALRHLAHYKRLTEGGGEQA